KGEKPHLDRVRGHRDDPRDPDPPGRKLPRGPVDGYVCGLARHARHSTAIGSHPESEPRPQAPTARADDCRMARIPAALGRVALGCVLLGLLAGCGRERARDSLAFDPDSVADAFLQPTGALMWPGATRAFQVTSVGDLTTGAWAFRMRPVCEGEAAAP